MVSGQTVIQREMRKALEMGLRQQYGEMMGKMLSDVIDYHERVKVDFAKLRSMMDNENSAVVAAIVANRVDAPLMLMLRSQMIGAALLGDKEAVVRWATEGSHRARRVGGPWASTEPEWKWILENVDRYILYARQLKYFLNVV